MLVHIGQQIVLLLPRLLVSIGIFLAFYVIGLVVKKVATKLATKADEDKSKVIRLIGSALKIVIIIVGLITALGTLGVDITAMVAGLGLTGFALGFALKDALSNLLAGILILFYHPFRCGDQIKVAGCEGVVSNINLRYTKLDNDDKEFLIPNSICFTNWIAVSKASSENSSN